MRVLAVTHTCALQVWMVVGAAISILLAVSVPGVAASYCTSAKPIWCVADKEK
jgi:hypothetical protein